jgi:hypothetical protein
MFGWLCEEGILEMLGRADRPLIGLIAALFAVVIVALPSECAYAPRPLGANNRTNQHGNQNGPLSNFWNWVATDSISFFTFVLAGFAGVQIVITGFQIRFLIRADQTARVSADAASKSANAAIAMERPRVRVTQIAMAEFDERPVATQIETPYIQITLRNYGRSPAYLIGSHMQLRIAKKLPPEVQYPEGFDQSAVIEPGTDFTWTWAKVDFRPTTDEIRAVVNRTAMLWIYGVILYEGFSDDEWRTGFSGAWNPVTLKEKIIVSFHRTTASNEYNYHT